MTFTVASNGTIHREGCEHANRVRNLSGGFVTIADARDSMQMDFSKRLRVAPCAKKVGA